MSAAPALFIVSWLIALGLFAALGSITPRRLNLVLAVDQIAPRPIHPQVLSLAVWIRARCPDEGDPHDPGEHLGSDRNSQRVDIAA